MMDSPVPPESPRQEGGLLTLGTILLRRRRLIVGTPFILCLIVGVVILLRPRTYTTQLALAPSSSAGASSRFAGIAAQFGLSIGGAAGGDAAANPDLYVDLIRSEQFRRALAGSTFWRVEAGGDTVRGELADLYDIQAATPAKRLYAIVQQLSIDVQAGTGLKSGLVNLSVRSEWPDVSLQMANRVLELVNEFGIANHRARAAEEARFTEERLTEAQSELTRAENAQRDFLARNRNYSSSPDLGLEYARLQRRVTIQEQVYAALAQSLAQARLDEFRNTPVISVVEPPLRAIQADRRGLILREVGTGVFGLGLGVGLALLLEYLKELELRAPGEASLLRRLWRETRTELGRLAFWRARGD